MSYEYKEILKVAARDFLAGNLEQDSETGEYLNLGEVEENCSDISIKIDHVYAQAAKADEYEANLNEVKKQLKIKIRHARRDGDFSEAYAFSEALDMIGNLI